MSRTRTLWFVLKLIFLVLFNTVFFLFSGTDHTAAVWISYGFIHLAYVMMLMTKKLTPPSRSARLFGATTETVSSVYFFAELIVGTVFICTLSESWKIALAVQLVIACIYAALLIVNLLANEKTAAAENRADAETRNIRNAAQRIAVLMKNTQDGKRKKTLERAFDLLQSCPASSHPAVRELEREIFADVQAIEAAATDGDDAELDAHISALQKLVAGRNRQLQQLQ